MFNEFQIIYRASIYRSEGEEEDEILFAHIFDKLKIYLND